MESSRTTFVPEVGLLEDCRPPGELSLVEIAERLEQVTRAIEAERSVEREARRAYQDVAARVEAQVKQIRDHARALVDEQRRRMASFDGMFARNGNGVSAIQEVKPPRGLEDDDDTLAIAGRTVLVGQHEGASRGSRLNIYDAVMKVWTIDKYQAPLTTTEIARAIKDVGYVTRAAPRSMKSTLNQALAKLCRDRRVRRFRTDGTEIPADDHHSRARKYMAWHMTANSAAEASGDAA